MNMGMDGRWKETTDLGIVRPVRDDALGVGEPRHQRVLDRSFPNAPDGPPWGYFMTHVVRWTPSFDAKGAGAG